MCCYMNYPLTWRFAFSRWNRFPRRIKSGNFLRISYTPVSIRKYIKKSWTNTLTSCRKRFSWTKVSTISCRFSRLPKWAAKINDQVESSLPISEMFMSGCLSHWARIRDPWDVLQRFSNPYNDIVLFEPVQWKLTNVANSLIVSERKYHLALMAWYWAPWQPMHPGACIEPSRRYPRSISQYWKDR